MLKYIIYYFGLEFPDNAVPLVQYAFNVGIVSLSVFLCFINVFGYLIVIYLIQYYDLDKKYTRFLWFINYFKKSSGIFLIIEGLLGFAGLIALIYLGFYPLFAS